MITSEELYCGLCGYTAKAGRTPTGNPTCPKCRVVMRLRPLTSKEQALENLLTVARSYVNGRGAQFYQLDDAVRAAVNAPETCEQLPDQLLDVHAICNQRDQFRTIADEAIALLNAAPLHHYGQAYMKWSALRATLLEERSKANTMKAGAGE